VNLNTVARAYRLLEEERFLTIRDRSGVRVAPPAAPPGSAGAGPLKSRLREILHHLRQSGLSRTDVRRMVEDEIGALARGLGETD
jgi:DNA-binding transcriptional regulator YhcF (GntR family)